MLEIIEQRISCYCAGTEDTMPMDTDNGKNLAVTILPHGSVRTRMQPPMFGFLGAIDSSTTIQSSPTTFMFLFGSGVRFWNYRVTAGVDIFPTNAEEIDAMNMHIQDFYILAYENNGVWNNLLEVTSALKAGNIMLHRERINLVALTDDTVHMVESTPDNRVTPYVQKTNAADQVIFGKLMSVTHNGEKCTVAVKGKNIIFAGETDDQPVESDNIGRGIISTTTVGNVGFGGAVGSRDPDEVGHVVGGTNDNIRVDLR